MKSFLVQTIIAIIIFIGLAQITTVPTGYATYGEWLECTNSADTEENYHYYLDHVEKIDF